MKLARIFLCLITLSFGSAAFANGSDLHLVLLKGQGLSKSFQREVDSLGGTITYSHDVGIAFVRGLSADAATQLGSHRDVKEVALDVWIEMEMPSISQSEAATEVALASAEDPTTAFFYSYQWNMPAISADTAWMMGRLGSQDITVAILDSGIDYMHPDLEGLVDLDRSASFVPSDDELAASFFPARHPITDLNFHGTHVAATVASNGLLAAGVTSGATLIGVKVCDWLGSCPFSSIVGGILHAAENGADVANMSLGGGFLKAGNQGFVGFLNRVFNYVNAEGMLVVVSAGNESLDLDHFPNLYKTFCSTPNTVCVSATGPTDAEDLYVGPWYDIDALAGYSNYGRSAINVAAPGGNSGGIVWAACSSSSLLLPFFGIDCSAGLSILGVTGTSMAAPHASGVAALIAEDIGRHPGRIKTKLQQSADDLGQPGTDPAYGKGRINAAHAVSY